MTSPSLAIIVCTYNRMDLLKKCLDSLVAQTSDMSKCETIVVDNNSADDTKELVTQYSTRIANLRYIFEREQGLSHARNRGCNEANSEYLAYLDNDVIAPPEYVSNVLKVIEQHSPDIMGGPIYPYYVSKKPNWFKDEYEIRKHAEESGFSLTCRISGGNYIIRKDALKQLGMFDVNLGMVGEQVKLGEERDILEKYRRTKDTKDQKTYFALDCCVKHYVPPKKMTLRYFVTRYYQSGRSAARLKRKNPSLAIRQIIGFFPRILSDLKDEIWAQGIRKADYVMILARASARLGNIVELSSSGISPVFGPVLRGGIRRASVLFGRTPRRTD